MAINRRQLLQAGAGFLLLPHRPAVGSRPQRPINIIGASRLDTDHYAMSAVSVEGKLQWQTPLPGRGHDVTLHVHRPIGVAVARRPGRYLVLFETRTGFPLQTLVLADDLTLTGHAAWINDRLIVPATDAASSHTRLQVFELRQQQLILQAEYALPYLGPHEIRYRQNRLVLAIGGLHTQGRKVLNRESIRSGVIELNPDSLSVTAQYWPSTHYVSWRHLDIDNTGQIVVAGQNQNPNAPSEALLMACQNNRLSSFTVPDKLWAQLKGYLGSIHACGDRVLASSPRAHWLGVFDSHSLALETQRFQHDVCAITSVQDQVFATSGTGQLWRDRQSTVQTRVIWDNHVTVG